MNKLHTCKPHANENILTWTFCPRPQLNKIQATQIWDPDNFIICKVLQTITLLPFYVQRLTVPNNKDLISVSAHETGSILKIGFVLSRQPHLQRAYYSGEIFTFELLLVHSSAFWAHFTSYTLYNVLKKRSNGAKEVRK